MRLAQLLLACILQLSSLLPTRALSQAKVFRIVGVAGTGTQALPESYVHSLQRWTWEESGLIRQQDTGEGSLQGSSFKVRPKLEFLIKGGVPTYVMVGLDIQDDKETPPRLTAQQWTTFEMSMFPNFRVVVYAGEGDGTDLRLLLADSEQIKEALEQLGLLLSGQEADELSQGFHLVSLPLHEWTEIEADETTTLTCYATAEPDARELFTLDDDLVEMTASSILQVQLSDIRKSS